ncbi:AAA family ATPase [Dethiosulfatarculus sandiegensis]|uniref:ATP-binding protein n=1 Tax=Dethiosulfatarculus sandiegensis TaxID=1429043 RepID=A0A0D2JA25_9BACT|nr:AAA family ATPase [Dethiosulfatarculus sandiegensis]KIX12511.1 ATP-binding protein [Dethiosulfatarculus sandiegensis]
MHNLFVFTGGPGSGKTTVITGLHELNFQYADEVGRKVIQRQVEQNGSALPWLDKGLFRDEMIREEIRNYNRYQRSKQPVFFDRGIVDSYGYSKLEKLMIPDELVHYCQKLRYNKKIFVFPPWKKIFINDTERKQNFPEAVATYNEMVKAYELFGYSLFEVPKTSVSKRIKFILSAISND